MRDAKQSVLVGEVVDVFAHRFVVRTATKTVRESKPVFAGDEPWGHHTWKAD